MSTSEPAKPGSIDEMLYLGQCYATWLGYGGGWLVRPLGQLGSSGAIVSTHAPRREWAKAIARTVERHAFNVETDRVITEFMFWRKDPTP